MFYFPVLLEIMALATEAQSLVVVFAFISCGFYSTQKFK